VAGGVAIVVAVAAARDERNRFPKLVRRPTRLHCPNEKSKLLLPPSARRLKK
jgi:hypothetical protein